MVLGPPPHTAPIYYTFSDTEAKQLFPLFIIQGLRLTHHASPLTPLSQRPIFLYLGAPCA